MAEFVVVQAPDLDPVRADFRADRLQESVVDENLSADLDRLREVEIVAVDVVLLSEVLAGINFLWRHHFDLDDVSGLVLDVLLLEHSDSDLCSPDILHDSDVDRPLLLVLVHEVPQVLDRLRVEVVSADGKFVGVRIPVSEQEEQVPVFFREG